MEACSLALKENRGIYSGVSERTIREDIRVMRSDILGFNAPISQKQGNYFYEDRSYSIFNVSIKESALLTRVLKFIVELQSELDHPDMDEIIESIDHALNEHKASSDLRSEIEELYDSKEPNIQDFQIFTSNDNLSWSGILNLLSDEP